jgi:hypothetical protein
VGVAVGVGDADGVTASVGEVAEVAVSRSGVDGLSTVVLAQPDRARTAPTTQASRHLRLVLTDRQSCAGSLA